MDIEKGTRFGRLVVTELGPSDHNKRVRFHCICDCGTERLVVGTFLRQGVTRSCGCLVREHTQKLGLSAKGTTYAKTHGHSSGGTRTPTYYSWQNMKTRCNNEKSTHYENYGGRGITYDPAWESFEQFLHDMGERPERTSLDRIDNNQGYSKENCRWADHHTQRMNQRRHHGYIPAS